MVVVVVVGIKVMVVVGGGMFMFRLHGMYVVFSNNITQISLIVLLSIYTRFKCCIVYFVVACYVSNTWH